MGIEENIKQKSFSSEVEKAMVNLSYTQSYMSSKINAALKPHKISSQQFNVLRILKGQHPDPVSINDITSRMVDKMSNASRLVDKLCKKELIIRSSCAHDKRQVDVNITEAGQQLLLELNSRIREVINEHSHLTDDEYKTLNELMDKFRLD